MHRRVSAASRQPDDIVATFTALLDEHVAVVNDFYMDRIEEGLIILHALAQHTEQLCTGQLKPEHRMPVQRSLVNVHFQLLLLQNYVALNFTAVAKILKKFEKKLGLPLRNDYIGALVELPFYRCDALGELVEETERLFRAIEGVRAAGAPPPPLSELQQMQLQQQPQLAAAAQPPQGLMPPPPPHYRPPACGKAPMAPAHHAPLPSMPLPSPPSQAAAM